METPFGKQTHTIQMIQIATHIQDIWLVTKAIHKTMTDKDAPYMKYEPISHTRHMD